MLVALPVKRFHCIFSEEINKKIHPCLEDFSENLTYRTTNEVRLGFLKTISFYMCRVWLAVPCA
jgi:hypothetical protein